jgi:hypothetical protein
VCENGPAKFRIFSGTKASELLLTTVNDSTLTHAANMSGYAKRRQQPQAAREAKWQIKKPEINEEAHWEAHWEGLTESEEESDAEFLIRIPVAQMEAKTDLSGWWMQQRYPWAQITPADSGER